jgi:hypothetical protein
MAEVVISMREFRDALKLPDAVTDLWTDAYMTKVVITVDPDREKQPNGVKK